MGIGTPPQPFTMMLDTGCSVRLIQWTWVLSSTCSECRSNAKKLSVSASPSYTSLHNRVAESYADGGLISGIMSQDSVTLGGVTANQSNFLLVTHERNNEYLPSDGQLGLGFRENSHGYLTLIEQMNATGVIPNALFSMYLSSGDWSQSMLVLGGVNLQQYALAGDTLTYIPVSKNSGFWTSSLIAPSVGGTEILALRTRAIFDSGTSLIYGPTDIVSQIYQAISQHHTCYLSPERYFLCYCIGSSLSSYPDVGFRFSGADKVFTLRPQTYFYKQGSTCAVMIMGDELDYWVLGDVFLREYYAVYDLDNRRIGLVRSVDVAVASTVGSLSLFWVSCVGIALSLYCCKLFKKGKSDGNYHLFDDPYKV